MFWCDDFVGVDALVVVVADDADAATDFLEQALDEELFFQSDGVDFAVDDVAVLAVVDNDAVAVEQARFHAVATDDHGGGGVGVDVHAVGPAAGVGLALAFFIDVPDQRAAAGGEFDVDGRQEDVFVLRELVFVVPDGDVPYACIALAAGERLAGGVFLQVDVTVAELFGGQAECLGDFEDFARGAAGLDFLQAGLADRHFGRQLCLCHAAQFARQFDVFAKSCHFCSLFLRLFAVKQH